MNQGLTSRALVVRDLDCSIDFYTRYAGMCVLYRSNDRHGSTVWLGDDGISLVMVLFDGQPTSPSENPLRPVVVACRDCGEVDARAQQARDEGILAEGPTDSGLPFGYWAAIRDPDGNRLELEYGREFGGGENA